MSSSRAFVKLSFVLAANLAGAAVCSCGNGNGSGSTGGGGSAGRGGTTSTGGTASSGGNAGGATSDGGANTGGAAAGGVGAGATIGSAGVAGGGGRGSGGAAGQAGAAGAGNASAGGGGGFGSPHGSAAKLVCAPGATYGNPLAGMSVVSTMGAPASDHFMFVEGAIWSDALSTLFFSDNGSNPERIFKLVPPSVTPSLFLGNSGSNGLGVDNSGRLIAADQRNKRIVHFDPSSGQIVGNPISTATAKPNDLIVRSDDNVYFTDPDTGFYRISPAGTVSAAMKLTNSNRPNGIELSLDEGTLYVGDVGNRTIAKYALAADGTVMTATGVNVVAKTMHDTVDGMCIDCAGNIYAGTSGGVEVYSSAGTYMGTVPTGSSSNCTFGGPDHRTLYVTSRTVLKSVTLGVPGLPD